jgi:lipopolysaccharide/colanic/teichoic acid biosynthesis glycosyltransferase
MQSTISPWCESRGKRLFDLIVALTAVIVTAPLMLALALAVRLSSPGPVLFRQVRSGRRGTEFVLLKFRTMRHESAGRAVTQARDQRVTPLGRVLRATKLDELPQLINVLRGEMSLVGPRPDLPQFWASANDAARATLALPPGITGAASLRFRKEEELLAGVPEDQLTAYYVAVHLPAKAAIDLEYASRATLMSDCAILLKTVLPFMSESKFPVSVRTYEPLPR